MSSEPRRVSRKISSIAESATLAVDAKAKALQAAGERVIGFGAGEPDFPTPEHIVEAAVAACRDPRNHRYTPTPGLPELRDAIAAKTIRDSGYACEAAQVLVTNGGKHAVYNAFQALLDPGDEVLLPAPYWTTYPETIALADGVPVVLPTTEETQFRVTVDHLDAARTKRTKALVFVSPSNPTGSVYTPAEVEAIARWAVHNNVWVITDEIYEHLTYGDHRFSSMPALVPEIADTCLVLNGVAKTYAMTGWRVGWMIGPRDVIAATTNLQSHSTSNVGNVSQRAALAAVSGDLERGRRHARRVRPARPVDAPDARVDPGRHLHGAAGRVLLLPELRGSARPRGRRPGRVHHARAVRGAARDGEGGAGARRGLRRSGVRAAVVRPGRRRPRRGCRTHRAGARRVRRVAAASAAPRPSARRRLARCRGAGRRRVRRSARGTKPCKVLTRAEVTAAFGQPAGKGERRPRLDVLPVGPRRHRGPGTGPGERLRRARQGGQARLQARGRLHDAEPVDGLGRVAVYLPSTGTLWVLAPGPTLYYVQANLYADAETRITDGVEDGLVQLATQAEARL